MSLITPILKTQPARPLETGEYMGILIRIVEKGTQEEIFHQTKQVTRRPKLLLTWVLPYHNVLIKGRAVPALVHKEFTNSLWEGAPLYKAIVAMRGVDFTNDQHGDEYNLLGMLLCPALLGLHVRKENGRDYIDVKEIKTLPEDVFIPDSPYAPSSLSFENWDWDIFDELPERTQADIKKAPEFAGVPPRGTQPSPPDVQTRPPYMQNSENQQHPPAGRQPLAVTE